MDGREEAMSVGDYTDFDNEYLKNAYEAGKRSAADVPPAA